LSNHSPFICDQNIRGGKVVLHSILTPPSEFEHVEKGDALYGMCLDSCSLLEIAITSFFGLCLQFHPYFNVVTIWHCKSIILFNIFLLLLGSLLCFPLYRGVKACFCNGWWLQFFWDN
jgi:hypothetical protein